MGEDLTDVDGVHGWCLLFALAATLGATEVVVWDLSHLRVKVGLAAGLLGLLTALRADAAEVSSASSGPR